MQTKTLEMALDIAPTAMWWLAHNKALVVVGGKAVASISSCNFPFLSGDWWPVWA